MKNAKVRKLAVEIYKAALRGAGRSVRNRNPWDDCNGQVKGATLAVARWHLRKIDESLKDKQT